MKPNRIALILAVYLLIPLFAACQSGKSGKGSPDGITGASKKALKDIPKHIREHTNEDGTGVNLNNSQIGVKGIRILANMPKVKNVVTLALKSNSLGDEGMDVLAESPTFQNVEKLSLWDNGITADGIRTLLDSPNFNKLKELNLMKNKVGDEGAALLANSCAGTGFA